MNKNRKHINVDDDVGDDNNNKKENEKYKQFKTTTTTKNDFRRRETKKTVPHNFYLTNIVYVISVYLFFKWIFDRKKCRTG